MSALLVGVLGGLGVHLLYTGTVLGWRGIAPGPRIDVRTRCMPDLHNWLRQAGLEDLDSKEFLAVISALFGLGLVLGYMMFGGLLPPLIIAGFVASFPIGSFRRRRRGRRQRAHEAWPRMIEEIRVQTTSLGRSIPQAMFEVGRRGPAELRGAFEAAHREWLLTTDLPRTLAVLKSRLSDPSADMVCETLLIAHEIGGSDLDRRLRVLAEDRLEDAQRRRDARSRQAGARFARLFVLLVPAGMALAGSSIGNGRLAYRTAGGQMVVAVALTLVAGCWMWAGRVMRIPDQKRVFDQ